MKITSFAGREAVGPVGELDSVGSRLAGLCVSLLSVRVDSLELDVRGVGEHHRALLGVRRAGLVPGVHHSLCCLFARIGDVQALVRLVGRERLVRAADAHVLPRLSLPLVASAVELRDLSRRHSPLQRREHPSRADRRQLRLVADEHELRVVPCRQLGECRQAIGVGHAGLVHHDDGFGVQGDAAVLCSGDEGVGRERALEVRVRLQALGGRPRDRRADHLVALALPRARRRGKDDALAASRLAHERADAAAPRDHIERVTLR